jgi:hypothetical protein
MSRPEGRIMKKQVSLLPILITGCFMSMSFVFAQENRNQLTAMGTWVSADAGTLDAGTFRVFFPSEPKYKRNHLPSGVDENEYSYDDDAKKIVYTVTYTNTRKALDETIFNIILAERRRVATKYGGKVVSVRAFRECNSPAREVIASIPSGGYELSRFYIFGSSLYMVDVVGRDEASVNREIGVCRFLQSFSLFCYQNLGRNSDPIGARVITQPKRDCASDLPKPPSLNPDDVPPPPPMPKPKSVGTRKP